MFVKPKGLLIYIKLSQCFFITRCNLTLVISFLIFIFYIINPISAITLHLNALVFVLFGIKYHLTEVLEQPGGGFPALNVMEIRDRLMLTYVNKDRYRLMST